ncbi:hypothetical protein M3Y97_00153400 [Aphelenchoides bicaudatus]|nr:hypothetical protein M3Y97_00153400 [Aphelenchoides bicaudatus]
MVWVSSYNRFIVFVLTTLAELAIGQDVLYGLPAIPGEPIPTTTSRPPSTHRLFRFGPFLPLVHHLPAAHPTLPPFLVHPFDTYNNINPIPELPPQPEAKYNGYYDLDGNFVSYGSDRARGYGVGKQRPKRELAPDSKDEALHKKFLEEEEAYDDDSIELKETRKTQSTSAVTQSTEATQSTTTSAQKEATTERTTVAPTSSSTKDVTTSETTTTLNTKQTPATVKPTQLPTKPLFVSGNSRSRPHSSAVQNNAAPLQNKPKTVDNQVRFNKTSTLVGNQSANSKGPYQVSKKPTQISSQHFAKGLVLPRQHQSPTQNRPPPNLQANFINAHKRPRTSSPQPITQKPRLPTRKINTQPRRPLKQRVRQFDPAPLKVATLRPFANQQPPQFVPLQQQQQRAWAAPLVPDNRDPTVIAYLHDLEEYDWTFAGERPNIEAPALAFQQANGITTTPETLIPLNRGLGQQTLIGTTLAPYVPIQQPSYTAPPPLAQNQQPSYTVAPAVYTAAPTYTQAPSADLLGWFSGNTTSTV